MNLGVVLIILAIVVATIVIVLSQQGSVVPKPPAPEAPDSGKVKTSCPPVDLGYVKLPELKCKPGEQAIECGKRYQTCIPRGPQ